MRWFGLTEAFPNREKTNISCHINRENTDIVCENDAAVAAEYVSHRICNRILMPELLQEELVY
jgi:hypothetical protein